MDKIKVDLHNCFGIQEMQHEFDFHGDNVIEAEGFMETPNVKQLVVSDFGCIDADGFYQLPLP